jgi:large subunit ribosomal protein L5
VAAITGQKAVITKAKMAVSNFKLRKDMPVGIVTTLRGRRAIDLVDRLVNIIIPRIRDFRGLSLKSFDGNGNYNIGFKEAIVFPEISPDDVTNVHGIQITIVTTAKDDEGGKALLKKIGFPFKKEVAKEAPSA